MSDVMDPAKEPREVVRAAHTLARYVRHNGAAAYSRTVNDPATDEPRGVVLVVLGPPSELYAAVAEIDRLLVRRGLAPRRPAAGVEGGRQPC